MQEGRQGAQSWLVYAPTFLLIASAFASISFWTDLTGHSSALAQSIVALIPWGSPRLFFLLGLALGAVLFAFIPRRLDFRFPFAHVVVGALSACATGGYVAAGGLDASVAAPLGVLSLVVIGMGFAWILIQLLAQLAQEERYSLVVGAIATALLLKTALVAVVGLFTPIAAQVFIAVMLPLLAAGLLITHGSAGDGERERQNHRAAVASPLEVLARSNSLSPRETEVFVLLAQGRSRPFIQQELFLADGTVKTHISRIYHKLGVANRQELITMAQKERGDRLAR
jgi:DNA-binding NarL/FixJ family response regulator